MVTSLGWTASPFVSCRVYWCRRALTTSARTKTPSRFPIPPKSDGRTDTRSYIVNTGEVPTSLFVRPWDGVPSMLDGFAMLRGIEKKYGKIKYFKFIRDGEIPSTYFSYFWVELEDPSRYPDDASTSLQIPIPELERKRSGGLGIADIQPFLRPPLEAQEEAHEWKGVTERMVDEVEESKRTSKVYDLRLEPSDVHTPYQIIERDKYLALTRAFVNWGGFASSPVQGAEAPVPSARPTFDLLIERAPPNTKTKRRPVDKAPQVEEEPHKRFNHEFDEPVRSTETVAPVNPQMDKASSAKPPSLLTMRREGKRLSKKQQALLQAAAISRTPLPKFEERPLSAASLEKEEGGSGDVKAAQVLGAETDEERKQIHSRVWDLVRSKWF